jgi:hypothetical protein
MIFILARAFDHQGKQVKVSDDQARAYGTRSFLFLLAQLHGKLVNLFRWLSSSGLTSKTNPIGCVDGSAGRQTMLKRNGSREKEQSQEYRELPCRRFVTVPPVCKGSDQTRFTEQPSNKLSGLHDYKSKRGLACPGQLKARPNERGRGGSILARARPRSWLEPRSDASTTPWAALSRTSTE